MSKIVVEVTFKCGHTCDVPLDIERNEYFTLGFMIGRLQGYNCPECGRRNAEQNISMLEEIVETLDPGRINRRRDMVKNIINKVCATFAFENIKFGVRRFDGVSGAKFVGRRTPRTQQLRWF